MPSENERDRVDEPKGNAAQPREPLEDLEPSEEEAKSVAGGIIKVKHDTAKNSISNVRA